MNKKIIIIIVLISLIILTVVVLRIRVISGVPPSGRYEIAPCDFNGDGECKNDDEEIFNKALNSCRGDSSFIAAADFDANGCVDLTDKHYLFD